MRFVRSEHSTVFGTFDMGQDYRGVNRRKLAQNLNLLWLLKGLESAWFPIPVIVLFYQSYGLSLAQAVMLKAILSGAIFLGEVPSGYFSDRFGRKTSLIGGSLLWLVGWLIYCTQGSFHYFGIITAIDGDRLHRDGINGQSGGHRLDHRDLPCPGL